VVLALAVAAAAQGAVRPPLTGAAPGVIDAGRLTPDQIARLTRGPIAPGTTIRIPASCRFPLEATVRGDVLVTAEPAATLWLVSRREVYLRFTGQDVQASLDGVIYRPLDQVFTGSIAVGLASGGSEGDLKATVSAEARVRGGGEHGMRVPERHER
jgi:hypothetical protein